jgi:hypothetical protein
MVVLSGHETGFLRIVQELHFTIAESPRFCLRKFTSFAVEKILIGLQFSLARWKPLWEKGFHTITNFSNRPACAVAGFV